MDCVPALETVLRAGIRNFKSLWYRGAAAERGGVPPAGGLGPRVEGRAAGAAQRAPAPLLQALRLCREGGAPYLSISIYLSFYISIYLSIYLTKALLHPYFKRSDFAVKEVPIIYPSLYIYFSIYLSIYLSICPKRSCTPTSSAPTLP